MQLIVHAGDFNTLEVLQALERSAPVHAITGNNDEPALQARLPTRSVLELDGARIGLVHDAGPSKRRLERLRAWFPDATAVIFGHSHLPLHQIGDDGFQIFNPGSPTERRRAPQRSMGLARVTHGQVRFELVPLGT